MCGENNSECCLYDLLSQINMLQNKGERCDISGCDRPFLGPTLGICYNTRPLSFYNCQTGELWEFTYTTPEGATGTSTVFRVENIDECCCTCRILIADTTDPANIVYTPTTTFFTIDLNCVSAVQCFADVFLEI